LPGSDVDPVDALVHQLVALAEAAQALGAAAPSGAIPGEVRMALGAFQAATLRWRLERRLMADPALAFLMDAQSDDGERPA
jgi:hypothetical protein